MNKKTMIFSVLSVVFLLSTFYVFIAGGQTSETNSSVGFEITVNYADGSPPDIYKQSSFSLLQLYTLVDLSNKEIESFLVTMKSTLKTSGTVTGWQIIGSIQTEVYKTPETIPKTSGTYEFDTSGTSWPDGETKQLHQFTLHWSQVEAAIAQFGEGSWSIQINGNVDISVDFADGSEDVADADAHASMPFIYENSGITQFSLSVNNGVTTYSLINQAEGVGIPGYALQALCIVATVVCAGLAVYYDKTGD